MKLMRRRIAICIIIYIAGVLTPIIIPMVKWAIIGVPFGKKVSVGKSIEVLALKEGVVLTDFINSRGDIKIDNIKTGPKIIVTQEYPSSQGFNYQQRINLNKDFAVMTYQDNWQPFWVGISNVNEKIKNIDNPTILLDFQGKMDVKVDKNSLGWIEFDPNFKYFLKTKGSIQPGQGAIFGPLFIKFPKDGIYNVLYSITSDSEVPISGDFAIKVVK